MIKERLEFFRRLLRAADSLTVTASFIGAYFLYGALAAGSRPQPLSLTTSLALLLIVLLIWSALLSYFGAYKSFRTSRVGDILWLTTKVQVVGVMLLSWFLFFFRLAGIGRGFLVAFAILSYLALTVERVGILLFLRAVRRRGFNFRNVLIVGTGARAKEFARTLESNREWGFCFIGFVDDNQNPAGQLVDGHRTVGTLDDLPRLTSESVIDEVIFAVPSASLARLDGSIRLLDELGMRATIVLDLFDLSVSRPQFSEVNGMPILTYASTPSFESRFLIKRIFDTLLAATVLLVLSPLFILIAMTIKLTSPGPVFFRQERVGVHGRRFTLLKFRSMVQDAEQRQQDLLALNEVSGPVFKMSRDPRITPVGRWLRKLSLDELPQLINVLRWEMSLVGPRPPLPHEVKQYQQWQRRRLSMPPGLTGLWQISGRNQVDFETWMRLDLAYIDNWSLGLDLKILAKTVPAVFSGRGAS